MSQLRTCLVTPCFLDGEDALGNNRLARNLRYMEYYAGLREELGFREMIFLDNASSMESITEFTARRKPNVFLRLFKESLTRGPGVHDYPYCWRALWHIRELLDSYDKIIFIDSDCFVLTKRMAEFIKNCNSGWQTFWNEAGGHPESTIWVLSWDTFGQFDLYTRGNWQDKVGTWMEKDLPFTALDKTFRCSRFGELDPPTEQNITMDCYMQARLTTPLQFGRYEK